MTNHTCIQTTDAFDRLPFAMYTARVCDRLLGLCGELPEGFMESRDARIRARWQMFRQIPEQVADDLADEVRIIRETSGERHSSSDQSRPTEAQKAHEFTMRFCKNLPKCW